MNNKFLQTNSSAKINICRCIELPHFFTAKRYPMSINCLLSVPDIDIRWSGEVSVRSTPNQTVRLTDPIKYARHAGCSIN